MIEAALDPVTLAKLARTGVGRHLGCYNWLRLDARHAAPRAHVLTELPALATFFAEALVPPQAALLEAIVSDPDAPDADADEVLVDPGGRDPHAGRHEGGGTRASHALQTLDLRAIAARSASSHSERWAAVLQRAVDAGQDRAVIEALAQRFSVADNLIRRLWREAPAALGQPPTWHLTQILRQLADEGERAWPVDDAQWHALIARAVPAEAG
jgi:hypothetical protein